MTKIKRLHFKDLNGLRFIAFVPVFLFICAALLKNDKSEIALQTTNLFELISINSFDFFLFLSAFLITSLSLREYKYRDSFAIKKFYMRRILRIIPLLIVALFFAFYIHDKIISFLKLTPIEPHSITHYLLGVPNFFTTMNNDRFTYTMAIWSVFMFIQFYFLWGIILKYFKSKLIIVGVIAIVLGIALRVTFHFMDYSYYFNTIGYGVSIGSGTILADLLRNTSTFSDHFKNLTKLKIRIFYLAGFLITTSIYPLLGKGVFAALIPLISSLFFGFVIMEQTFAKNSIFKLRKNKILNRLGKISFGLLIFTPIIGTILIIAFESLDKGIESPLYKFMFIGFTFVLSWMMADISHNSFEKLFMRIKRDFKRV